MAALKKITIASQILWSGSGSGEREVGKERGKDSSRREKRGSIFVITKSDIFWTPAATSQLSSSKKNKKSTFTSIQSPATAPHRRSKRFNLIIDVTNRTQICPSSLLPASSASSRHRHWHSLFRLNNEPSSQPHQDSHPLRHRQ